MPSHFPFGLNTLYSIEEHYFDNMVSQTYSSALPLNKANNSDKEVAFKNMHTLDSVL